MILMSTVSRGWSTLMLPISADGLACRLSSSITPCAVARLLAMSTYDLARDFARVSATDPRAGFESLPALTKPVALAAYTFGWVRLKTAAAAMLARISATTPVQCARRTRR